MARDNCNALFRLSLLSLILFCSLYATASKAQTTAAAAVSPSAQLPSGQLAILPFVKGDFTENFRTQNFSPLTCPLDQICLDLNEADETILFMERLNKDLHQILKQRMGANLLSMNETKNHYNALPIDPSKDTSLSMALRLAQEMKTDYVLIPILWHYSERIGSQISASEPASVSFALYLIAAHQEKQVWKAHFEKTQQSLSDNILNAKEFFKLGGKWLTAEELTQIGIQKLLEDFPLLSQ